MHHDGADPPGHEPPREGRGPSMPWGEPLRGDGVATSEEVRLRREFKGITVRDLIADAGLDEQLPGRVQSALEQIQKGDYAAAERALPGSFGSVIQGPFLRPRQRSRVALWIVLSALAAALATATMALL